MSVIHIIISGASSVGKSTLVDECCRKFSADKKLKSIKFERIQEVARRVLHRLNITGRHLENFIRKHDIEKFSNIQEKIIEEQISCFREAEHKNYISDRSGFDALAYIHFYFNNENESNAIFQSPLFQQLIDQCYNGLIFIVQPQEELKAQNDNMRIVPNYHDQIQYTNCLRYWYRKANLSYFTITDLDLSKRVEFIEKHVDGNFHWELEEMPIPLYIPFHIGKPEQRQNTKEIRLKSNLNQSYIRFIEILDKHNLKISYKKYEPNRFIEKYDGSCLKNKFASIVFSSKLDNEFVMSILLNGVSMNGERYHFMGYSNSQLKNCSCYLFAGTIEQIQNMIDENGDFYKIKNLSKRAARIGLLFSSCTPTIDIPSNHVIEIDDIERNDYNFTDGCGIIGRALAKQIVPYLKDFEKPILTLNDTDQFEETDCPCAFQIRYQGCKGVLMINDDVNDETIQIRPSMKKFTSTISTCLYVCDDGYSRPRLGFLIKQFILLLSGLKIPDEVFLNKQAEYFQDILKMCDDKNIAMKYFLYFDRMDLFHQLLSNDIQSLRTELQQLRKKALESLEKLKIPITKSRLAFGVCDPYGVLKSGEVYFQPTLNGRQFMLDSKICFVAKSPSYHLGDIRVLKLTSYQQLEHLYDVIVFPTQGQRPHSNEIAGSDLDGDKYLICWDNDMIPKQINKPMNYNLNTKSQESALITREELITHFANAKRNNQSGIVDKYFNYWAEHLGVNSIQCRRLAELFSQAVDAPKTGQKIRIPSELRPPRNEEKQNKSNEFVWIRMLNNAKQFKEDFQIKSLKNDELINLSKESLLNIFFERRYPTKFNYNNVQSLDEYFLIVATIKWANEQENADEILKDFVYLFDFSQLTMEQKQNIELSLKIDQFYLYSTLKKSKILSNELIEAYHLNDTPLSWRLYYFSPKLFNISSLFEYEQTFQPIIYVLKQNSIHERTLINISIDDSISLVLDVYKDALIQQEQETIYQIQSGLFNVYFESKLFSIRKKFLLDVNYYINMRDDRIQIYENDPRNSFIVFMYDLNSENKILSVDLTRFDRNILRERNHPKVNKHDFFYFEIFILSNDQQISKTNYYPINSFFDEEYFTQNYFNEQIDNYQYIEYLTEQEQADEEKYKNEQKQMEEKRNELKIKFDHISQENLDELIEGFMFIHNTEYLHKIYFHENRNQLNEQFLKYLFHEIESMLNGSIYRPYIDEQWLYYLIITSNYFQEHFHKLFQLSKKLNLKLKDKSQPIYIPYVGRILQRLFKEKYEIIQTFNLNNNEVLYNLYLSLILTNNYNADEINLNYFMEIRAIMNTEMRFEHILNLIQACLMTKDSEICLKFIEILSSIEISSSEMLQHSETLVDYVIQFLSIIIRTIVYDLDEINRRLYLKREILVKNGETLLDLKAKLTIQQELNETNNDDDENSFEPVFNFEHYRNEQIPSHHFNIGDSIALIDQQLVDEYLLKQDTTSERVPLRLFYQSFGIILTVSPYLKIRFPYWPQSLTSNNYLNRQKLFRLERLPNFVTLNRSIDAFRKIIEQKQSILIKPFLDLTANIDINQLNIYAQEKLRTLEIELNSDHEYICASLNESQRKAIKHGLENRLTIIQGPPGTGKTETSAWIIRLWLKYCMREEKTILVCAETHQAVDNLTRRLLKEGQYRLIRYGEPRTVAPDLHEYTMTRQVELLRREQKNANKSLFGPPRNKEIRQLISKCQILCMTCSGVGILESKFQFPFILIDEASQITEPNILIPLVRITEQIVLVGDQKQLPPIIKMAEAKQLLERSFFQRLLENLHIDSIMLDTQYRMHPELIKFPSMFFYDNQLKSGVSPEQRPTPKEIKFINKSIPLMFVDVDQGNEIIRGSNIFNPHEVHFVCQTVQLLLPRQKLNLSPSDIGVITPYTRQVQEIVDKLQAYQIPKGVEVRTVDGFQGREKEIILISLVRSNNENEIGFLTNQQRMNVLLTRAKCAMIVFGNKRTLTSNELWKSWIENVPNISSFEFENQCLIKQNITESTNTNKPRGKNHQTKMNNSRKYKK